MDYDRNSWFKENDERSEVVIYPKDAAEAELLERYILSGKFKRDFERWLEDEEENNGK